MSDSTLKKSKRKAVVADPESEPKTLKKEKSTAEVAELSKKSQKDKTAADDEKPSKKRKAVEAETGTSAPTGTSTDNDDAPKPSKKQKKAKAVKPEPEPEQSSEPPTKKKKKEKVADPVVTNEEQLVVDSSSQLTRKQKRLARADAKAEKRAQTETAAAPEDPQSYVAPPGPKSGKKQKKSQSIEDAPVVDPPAIAEDAPAAGASGKKQKKDKTKAVDVVDESVVPVVEGTMEDALPEQKKKRKKNKVVEEVVDPVEQDAAMEDVAAGKKKRDKKRKAVDDVSAVEQPVEEAFDEGAGKKKKKEKKVVEVAPVVEPVVEVAMEDAPSGKRQKKDKKVVEVAAVLVEEPEPTVGKKRKGKAVDPEPEPSVDKPASADAPPPSKKLRKSRATAVEDVTLEPQIIEQVAVELPKLAKKAKTKSFVESEPIVEPAPDTLPVPEPPKKTSKKVKAASPPPESPVEADEEDDDDAIHGFMTDDEDSSDDDEGYMDVEVSAADISKLPTVAKDDVTVKKRLENAKRKPATDRGVLFLSRIPHGFYEDQAKAYFTQFGNVTRLRISRNKKTGKSKHYGFIEFDSSSVAQIVAETMDNYLLLGHILRCKVIPKDKVHPELWTDKSEIPPSPIEIPSKRKREEDEEAAHLMLAAPAAKRVTVLTFSKHPRFWALDGNVVLRFGQAEMKLHRSRLATQSPWFAKLFDRRAGMAVEVHEWEKNGIETALASVSEENGCDVYTISDRTCNEVDFVALLSAMDDAIKFADDPPSFPTAASIFRAATSIFRAASSLSCKPFEQYAQKYIENIYSDDLADLGSDTVPNPVAAIVLGRKWGLPRILKRAFYELLRSTTIAELLLGQPGNPEESDMDDESPSQETDRLPRRDVICLLEAQKRLSVAWMAVLADCPLDCSCMTRAFMRKAWLSIVQEIVVVPSRQDDEAYPAALDIFLGLDKLVAAMGTSEKRNKFCCSCISKRRAAFQKTKEGLWESLDEWLDIEN
uniref:RRM domain-containing protein n=1 Tax=Mycena chlorophos TaxID=658473 RepID=A0ABQ0MC54_MYCCL|nr:predicted protein [Mycena chlorophos]